MPWTWWEVFMELSVIICTYKRPDLVKNVLSDLERAAYQVNVDWEIILIDNAGDKIVKSNCERSVLFNKNILKYFYEPCAGVSMARNRAVRESSGKFLLFLDDDVRFDSSFLRKIFGKIESDRDVDILSPRIITPIREGWPRWLRVRLASGVGQFELGDEVIDLNVTTKIPIGACVCVRRKVCIRYGPFEADLDRAGKMIFGGGETLLLRRALKDGVRGRYFPDIIVRHELISNKQNKRYWRRHAFYGGRTYIRMQNHMAQPCLSSGQLVKFLAMGLGKAAIRALAIPLNPARAFENQYRAISRFGRVYEAMAFLLDRWKKS